MDQRNDATCNARFVGQVPACMRKTEDAGRVPLLTLAIGVGIALVLTIFVITAPGPEEQIRHRLQDFADDLRVEEPLSLLDIAGQSADIAAYFADPCSIENDGTVLGPYVDGRFQRRELRQLAASGLRRAQSCEVRWDDIEVALQDESAALVQAQAQFIYRYGEGRGLEQLLHCEAQMRLIDGDWVVETLQLRPADR